MEESYSSLEGLSTKQRCWLSLHLSDEATMDCVVITTSFKKNWENQNFMPNLREDFTQAQAH